MDVDDFFEEQERRMNLPDEDIDEYIRTRLAATRATQSWSNPIQDNAMPMLNCVTYDGHCITCVSNSPEQHTSFGMTSTYSSSPLDNLPTRSKRKISENPVDGPSKRTKTGQPHSVHPVVPDIRASPTHNETSSKLTKDYILVDSAAKQASNSDPSTGTAASRHHSGGGFAQNGSALDDNTPRTTCSRRSTESKSLLPEDSAVDVIVITRSRQHPVCSGQNNVSGSTDLDLEGDHPLQSEPHSLELPGIQEISGAVSGAEVVIRSSNHASSHGEPSRVMNNARSVESEGLSTTVSDHSPAADVFSCSSVTSHRGGAFHKPTLIVHVQDSYPTNGSPQCPDAHPLPCISPVRIPPSIPPTPPENVATSASRPARDSRGDDTAQVSTPRPFSEADVSNITSPGLTPLFRGGSKRESAEPKLRETVHRNRKMKATMSTTKGRKKAQLMTPLEYAQRLQSNLVVSVTRKTNYLQGKQIFYVGGDMQFASAKTRGRMEYIVKHGGTLVPKYDPAFVTHIVTDVNARSTLRALSLKSLLEIPRHIPTVTWSWVISGYERASRDKDTARGNGKGKGKTKAVDAQDNVLDLEFLHAAFPERIDAGSGWLDSFRQEKSGATSGAQSSKAKIFNDGSGDVSGIFDFTQENPTKKDTTSWRDARLTVLPPPPLDLKSSEGPDRTRSEAPEPPDVTRSRRPSADTENGAEDPLSEYYAHAKAERDAAWKCNESESDDGDDDEDDGLEVLNGPAPKRGFTCDHKQPQQAVCANQDVVDKLEELMELHKAKPSDHDRWRVFSYAKCIRALRNYPKPIRSFSEARFIRGVGEKTALKIMEIIETGRLRRIAYERTEDVEATKLFQGIYGVGRKTAFAWFASGMRTLDDIKARKGGLKLSPVQEIGLRFYDDINSRIPRAEVERIFDMIKPKALAIDSNIFIEIMGSFRRGKADCGDIDILITRPTTDGKTHQGVLPLLLERLHAANILTEDLALPEDFSMLELTYRGLCKLPEAGAKRRRIDILCVPWESRGAALLYYTGDDIFNRAMRMKANVLGYSLNQRGLYSGVVRDPRNRTVKVCNGSIIASETEEEIFKILGVPWQEPHERVRG